MIGVCSITFREKSIEDIIALVAQTPLKTIEWWGKRHLIPGDISEAERTLKLMRQNNLIPSSYGSYYKVGSFGDFKKVLDTTVALNAQTIRVWGGEKPSEEVDSEYFGAIIDDTKRISTMAKEYNVEIGFEYHLNTITDSAFSAKELMVKVEDFKNVSLYWQPGENLSFAERSDSIKILHKWLSNVHVFHWENYDNRFHLSEGKKQWAEYIRLIERQNKKSRNYLLEFVKDDDESVFLKDAMTLYEIINGLLVN